MHPQKKDSVALAIAVIAILGVALFLSANHENIRFSRNTTALAGGVAGFCPFIKHFAGIGVAHAPACGDATAIAQAESEAFTECIGSANAYTCPAWCPNASSQPGKSQFDMTNAPYGVEIVVPAGEPVYPCIPQEDGTVIIQAFAFCDVECSGGSIIEPKETFGDPVSVAPIE